MENHKAKVSVVPLSVMTVAGTPKRATQPAMKAFVHILASMLYSGTASIHLVDLSINGQQGAYNPPKRQVGPSDGFNTLSLKWRHY
jgi:hypothetical protein